MNKVAVVLPYFGNFPNYFDLWLDSCIKNENIDWIIVTDNNLYCNASNIKIINISFDSLRKKISDKFKKIYLKSPYKLCDFKPLYGYIFEEEFEGYDFWGWCDCDLIFGDILKILPEDVWLEYDRILDKGHLTFIRNSKELSEMILSYDYINTIVSGKAIYAWDEIYDGFYKGLSQLMIENNYKVFDGKYLVSDIDYRHKYFRVIEETNTFNVFKVENKSLYKIFVNDKSIDSCEILYIHLQKRKMNVNTISNLKYFIIPNEFTDKITENDLTVDYIKNVNNDEENYFNIKKEVRWYRMREIMRFLHEPKKLSALLYVLKNRR